MRRLSGVWLACVAVSAFGWLPPSAIAQMPDARSMSGVPRPVEDLAAGVVSIRVVRDELTNALPGQKVTLSGGGKVETIVTDADGRAQFTGVAPGTRVSGSVAVGGQTISSEPFEIPSQGGIRMLLVATSSAAAGAGGGLAPSAMGAAQGALPGGLTFGGDTRVVVQFDDDQLEIFYLLDLLNGGTAPVTGEPLVFQVPAGAANVALLEGSSPQAEVSGRTVKIRGPFAPGLTSLQVAFNLAVPGDRLVVTQAFPATLQQLVLFVQKVPGVRLASTQVGDQRELPAEGRTFVSAIGPAVKANAPFSYELSGLPHRSAWPRNAALILALLVAAAGVWGAIRTSGGSASSERARLEARRDRLFSQVLAVDRRERDGALEPRASSALRAELTEELERIYGALDVESPQQPSAGSPAA